MASEIFEIKTIDDIKLDQPEASIRAVGQVDNDFSSLWIWQLLQVKFAGTEAATINNDLKKLKDTNTALKAADLQAMLAAFENAVKNLEVTVDNSNDIKKLIILLRGLYARAEINNNNWGASVIKAKTGLDRKGLAAYGKRAADELEKKLPVVLAPPVQQEEKNEEQEVVELCESLAALIRHLNDQAANDALAMEEYLAEATKLKAKLAVFQENCQAIIGRYEAELAGKDLQAEDISKSYERLRYEMFQLDTQNIHLQSNPESVAVYNPKLVQTLGLSTAVQAQWQQACELQEQKINDDCAMALANPLLKVSMRAANYMFGSHKKTEQAVAQINNTLKTAIIAKKKQISDEKAALDRVVKLKEFITPLRAQVGTAQTVIDDLQQAIDSKERAKIKATVDKLSDNLRSYVTNQKNSWLNKLQDILHIGKEKRQKAIAAALDAQALVVGLSAKLESKKTNVKALAHEMCQTLNLANEVKDKKLLAINNEAIDQLETAQSTCNPAAAA